MTTPLPSYQGKRRGPKPWTQPCTACGAPKLAKHIGRNGTLCSLCNSRKYRPPKGYRSGPTHPQWRGGRSREKLQNSYDYKVWRKSVFERDNYTCRLCGKRGVKLNADHILPVSFMEGLALWPGNGRTLCVECHRKTSTYGSKAKIFLHTLCRWYLDNQDLIATEEFQQRKARQLADLDEWMEKRPMVCVEFNADNELPLAEVADEKCGHA